MDAPTPADPVPAPPRRRMLLPALGRPLAALVLLFAMLAGLLAWGVHTPTGTRTLLGLVPGVRVTSPSGTLLGDFAAERVEIALGQDGALVLTRPHWRELRLARSEAAPWGLRVAIAELAAGQVDIRPSTPSADKAQPMAAPRELVLPVGIDIEALRVGALTTPGLTAPVRNLQARLSLAGGDGVHRLEALQLEWDRLRLHASATLGARAPLPLQAHATLSEVAGAPETGGPAPAWSGWTAQVDAEGILERFAATASLQASGQGLEARADVTPFAALPLSQVHASAQALDLAALVSGAPRTALSGDLSARLAPRPPAAGAQAALPLTLDIDLRNTTPGAWDRARLPLARLQIRAQGDANDMHQGELSQFRADFSSGADTAGFVTGRGGWNGERWTLDARFSDVLLAALDGRAPALALNGPLALRGVGGVPGQAPAGTGAAAPQADVKASLQARWAKPPPSGAPPGPWQIDAAGQAAANALTLQRLELQSPGGRALLAGSARHSAARPAGWQVRGELTLDDLDPSVLPAVAAAVRGGTTRLNGNARFDLRLPERAPAGTGLAPRLAAWRGSAQASMHDSLLAGVPLAATLALTADEASARVTLNGSLDAAGNRASVNGSLDTRDGKTPSDHWRIEADAPVLAKLEPALRLLVPNATLSGAVAGHAELDGRWPSLTSQGKLDIPQLRAAGLSVDAGAASWNLGTDPAAAMNVQVQATQLVVASQRLSDPKLEVDGSGRDHRIALRFDAAPPYQAAGTTAATASEAATHGGHARRLRANLQARGAWTADTARHAVGWRGRVQQLDLVAVDDGTSTPLPAGSGPVWLRAQPFDVAWSQGDDGQQLEVGPTRLGVLDAMLQLRALTWTQAAGQPTRLAAEAELEPLAIEPLLDRLQPDFGWGGNLRIGGRLALHSDAATGFRADVQLERISGDLNVTDPSLLPAPDEAATLAVAASGASGNGNGNVRGITRRLGLREARLAFSARDGMWRFTQQLDGRGLGRIAGEQTVRTDPQAVWPAPDASVQGQLDVQVDDLATWGRWAPAGWRLVGELAMQARVGGRFGAPEFTGRLSGSGIGARNLLLGVDIRDGEIAASLDGPTARIERFVLHGEQGTLRAEGGAEFGAAPRAQLQVVADRFAALNRVDRKAILSGQAQLELRADAVRLRGDVTVDEALIDISTGGAPSLGDDVSVVGRDTADETAAAPTSARRAIDLQLALDLGQQFRLRGLGINTLLRGSLRVTAPSGKPAVNGTIRTAEGSFNAYAQSLTIARGTVAFSGPPDNPRLDILALRTQSPTARETDVKVGVSVTGPAQDPRVRLYSEPEMSETEKLSWLVLGRGPNELGRTEMALLQQGALALLAGEGEGDAGGVLQRIGLDELSVSQSDGAVRETIVSVGKQISDRWFVGYERSLTATTGTWQLIYRAAQRFTLRAQSGFENALDLIWTWRWN